MNNPPPNAASAALIDGDKVLLIQRTQPPYQHHWTLPGGRSESGETGEQCATREAREELGLEITDLRLVQTTHWIQSPSIIGTDPGRTWRLAVFTTQTFEGTITPSDEISDYRWVPLDQLGELRTTGGLADVLAKAFALYAQTDR
jgi:ADP-ribose pyrophosphatase YjhB (NUDIX family)